MLRVERLNPVWCADLTYIPIRKGSRGMIDRWNKTMLDGEVGASEVKHHRLSQ